MKSFILALTLLAMVLTLPLVMGNTKDFKKGLKQHLLRGGRPYVR